MFLSLDEQEFAMQVVDENQPANVARNGAKALKKSKTIEET